MDKCPSNMMKNGSWCDFYHRQLPKSPSKESVWGCLLDLTLCSFLLTSLGDLQYSAFQSMVVKEVARVVNHVSLIRSFANTFK